MRTNLHLKFTCCSQLLLFWDVLIDQLLDFNSDLFLERTCPTSSSLPIISWTNGTPCLVLKPIINFCDRERGLVASPLKIEMKGPPVCLVSFFVHCGHWGQMRQFEDMKLMFTRHYSCFYCYAWRQHFFIYCLQPT